MQPAEVIRDEHGTRLPFSHCASLRPQLVAVHCPALWMRRRRSPGEHRSARGRRSFNDIVVNTVSSGQQLKPKIDMSLNGTFAIVWEDDSNSNGYYEIMLAGFASNGQRLSTSPSAAVNKNGYYEIVANDIQL